MVVHAEDAFVDNAGVEATKFEDGHAAADEAAAEQAAVENAAAEQATAEKAASEEAAAGHEATEKAAAQGDHEHHSQSYNAASCVSKIWHSLLVQGFPVSLAMLLGDPRTIQEALHNTNAATSTPVFQAQKAQSPTPDRDTAQRYKVQADAADEEDETNQIVDAPRVVSLPLTSWRFKTGLTNLSTECIKRMYDRGIFCPKDNVVYTVAWPRF